MELHIVHGANLGELGKRQPELYGNQTLAMQIPLWEGWVNQSWPDVQLHHFQSDIEGELVQYLHKHDGPGVGFLINAGGYTHSSVVLADAIASLDASCLEIHLSHTYAREDYRHVSLMAPHVIGTISGLGWLGYRLGMEALLCKD